MINNSILNIKNQKIYIYNLFGIILISLLFITSSSANEDSKKCIVYMDGQLIYNPDNPKIHCTTLQILDNFWDNNNTNIPNPNKKPEDFTEILTTKDVISNGNMVCKNPSASNTKFTIKDAIEGETISGQCNEGYTGTVSATCQKDGNWSINNNCFSDCNNLENMYVDSSFINTTQTISNDEFVYSKCSIGYDGYQKHKCKNGIIGKTENLCILNTNYCQKLTNIENGSITYGNNQAINSTATLKCNTGYKINGNSSILCNADNETNGKWSDELGRCEIVRCPTTNLTITNGSYPTISSANNSYNTAISGICNTGYTGTISAVCDANGEWVKSGSCTLNLSFCPSISVTKGSLSFSNSMAMNSVATLKCNSGHGLVGNSTATCQANGKWNRPIGSCHAHCENQSYSFTIKICTGKGDADCIYDGYPYGEQCILKDNRVGTCKAEGIATVAHGTSGTNIASCGVFLVCNSAITTVTNINVQYKLTCTDGVLSISKPD